MDAQARDSSNVVRRNIFVRAVIVSKWMWFRREIDKEFFQFKERSIDISGSGSEGKSVMQVKLNFFRDRNK